MKKLSNPMKRMLREMVNQTCELCGKHELEVGALEIHRMKRGCRGGDYIPRNIMVICNKCHKEFHAGEQK